MAVGRPYVGPVKLFLLAGAALTSTWILTRAVDAQYDGLRSDGTAADYIDMVVRGLLASSVAVAATSWLLGGARRRLLDEAVFTLHLVTALSVLCAGVIWLAALWKLGWGTEANVPSGVPSLPVLLFLPAGAAGLAYVAGAVRRVHGGPWWATSLRTLALAAAGLAALTGILLARG